VQGARANDLEGAIDEDEKQDRWERFMEHQRLISERRMQRKVGKTLEVLIDEPAAEDEETGEIVAVGRSAADAPEIDGNVFVEGAGVAKLKAGDQVKVTVDAAEDYDLRGKISR
jgi:ribosomal protein S12 methylthiotransferase